MAPSSRLDRWTPRVVVFAIVLGLVLLASAGMAYQRLPAAQPSPAGHPEYDVDSIMSQRTDTGGKIQLSGIVSAEGVVLVDNAHLNRVQSDEVRPFLRALTRAGFRIRMLDSTAELDAELARADAFVVLDPGVSFSQSEADAIADFAADGGRVLLAGEPTRTQIQTTQLGTISTVAVRNELHSLASRFGIEFGAAYLYNLQRNDGNYRNVFASPGEESSLTAGVDRTVVYTGTSVRAPGGSTLLRAATGTRSGADPRANRYPVAVRQGNVIALGDTTMLTAGHQTVADNDVFISHVIGFLAAGNQRHTVGDYPAMLGPRPAVAYTNASLLEPSQALAADLRSADKSPSLTAGLQPGADPAVLLTTFEHLAASGRSPPGIAVQDRGGNLSVRTAGYDGPATGIAVVRMEADGDLVIVGDGEEAVAAAVDRLEAGTIAEVATANRTAVVKSG
ncbi:MAG: DUF4350 domain-containing protein [Halodesulfurarchaeum sp.]